MLKKKEQMLKAKEYAKKQREMVHNKAKKKKEEDLGGKSSHKEIVNNENMGIINIQNNVEVQSQANASNKDIIIELSEENASQSHQSVANSSRSRPEPLKKRNPQASSSK